jgi:anaerobic magnesium-protoporphyrin IX monomethyl ester cyclase
MDKGIRVEEIKAARENLRRHGIRACFFLQFGYPGEEWSDIEATIQMVRDVRPDDIGVSVSYPLPGTKFHETVARELSAHANWSDSADLAMMFRGTYTTDFYRALADALHLEVRGQHASDHALDKAAAWQRVRALDPASSASEMLAQ